MEEFLNLQYFTEQLQNVIDLQQVKSYFFDVNGKLNWTVMGIILGVLFGYLVICSIIGARSEKKAFFYSYLDVFVTLMIPALFITTSVLAWKDYIVNDELFLGINAVGFFLLMVWLWIITYRANNGSLMTTLFMLLGKFIFIILSGVFIPLFMGVGLVFCIGDILVGDSGRKKYQRKKAYREQKAKTTNGIFACGFSMMGAFLANCKYDDFSMPPKVGSITDTASFLDDEV